jgi:hypothetical protein
MAHVPYPQNLGFGWPCTTNRLMPKFLLIQVSGGSDVHVHTPV